MKKQLLLFIIVLFLIPAFTISIIYNSVDKKEQIIQSTTKNSAIISTTTKTITTTNSNNDITITIKKNNEILTLSLEKYIIGVVAGEMPASFEIEALEAQAITSRTYAMYNKANKDYLETTTDDQIYINEEEMHKKWKEDYDVYYKRIETAVNNTKNLVMKKNNKLFKSYYFSMSNGYTEDSVSVFKENTSSSVKSSWDNSSLNKFEVSTTYTINKLTELTGLDSIESINIISRNKTNHVTSVQINDKTYTGIELRKILTLRSTDFEVKKENDSYIFITKGYGHGVGMSQYGANGMAKENHTYAEILKYYYQNIEITNI